MNKIEEIIKVAIEGKWKPSYAIGNKNWQVNSGKISYIVRYHLHAMLLDPNFFRAIGKTGNRNWMEWAVCLTCGTKVPIFRECNCDDDEDTTPEPQMAWEWYWHKFIHKIAEKDLDHAIEWLYNLIKE